jgi:hypothetical protein
MASIKEFKVLVRKNSTVTYDYLIEKYKRIMNQRQEDKSNIFKGSYINIYYALIIDFRNLQKTYVFCDYATKIYNISDNYITSSGSTIEGVMIEPGSVNNKPKVSDV